MRLVITAGGTGGHIIPALAISQALLKRKPDANILFIGTDRGLEERLAAKYGIPFVPIRSAGIKGKSIRSIPSAFIVNTAAFITAFKIVSGLKPDWVIGTGGYVTGMVVLAGRLTGARCAIQEQNSVPGLTNKVLAHFSHRIFLSFPDAAGSFPAGKTVVTGNPLRPEFQPAEGSEKKTLLIMGGSLGATSINKAAVKALEIIRKNLNGLEIIHQTGGTDEGWVKKAYDEMGIKAKVEPFIEDMASVFARTKLAVCRAGGITLSELSRMGVPAIMVPLPSAADNHQYFNALYIAEAGGGWILDQAGLAPETLSGEVLRRLADEQSLSAASSASRRLGLGDGTEHITEELIKCSGE
jgi:UDP-N-acetylglucosamine--N-acetylmuramyl-(pentapeptide) pyrophosphoryl-undecaprenol N-acetylglucosamine transferase